MDYWGANHYFPGSKVYGYLGNLKIRSIVQSTISMCSMHANARGVVGMPP